MRYLSMTIFLLLSAVAAHAQKTKLDSINRLISIAKTDTGRINRLVDKINLLANTNIDSALSLSASTIEYAKKVKYPAGEGRARMQRAIYDSYKGNFAASMKNLRLSEKILTSVQNQALLIKLYNSFGNVYGIQSKYDSSLTFLKKGLTIAEAENDKNMMGTLYMNIGNSYQMLSNQPQALFYQQKALKIAEDQNDIGSQAYCLVNMANTLKLVGDLKGCEKSMHQSIVLAKKASLKNVELYAYTNLAALYGEQKMNQKGYDYAMKAANLAKETGDPGIQATSLSRAANILAKEEKFDEAEKLVIQSMEIADESQQPLNIHQTYSAMGVIKRMQKKYTDAIPYFEKSFDALKNADIYDSQTGEMYSELSLCYEKSGNFPRALKTHKIAAAIADSVRGKENIRKTTELSMTYAFEKQQQAAQAEQQKQNALAKTRQNSLMGGMGLMLALAGMSFYAYHTKQKANGLLEVQKTELEQTLSKLKTTQTQLIHSEKMASLGELTAGIAHEIQNPLNFVNNFSEVSVELADEIQQELEIDNLDEARIIAGDIKDNLQKIILHGKRADSIVKGMLEHSRSSSGILKPTNLHLLIDEYLKLAFHGFRVKDPSFHVEMVNERDSSIGKINAAPQDLGRVLLNLFNNAFYAVKERQQTDQSGYVATIIISTQRRDDFVEIHIKDNGTGIPVHIRQKVFQPFFTTKPTGQGTGLGLSISYDIVTKGHGGKMEVNSEMGQGTVFSILLPA